MWEGIKKIFSGAIKIVWNAIQLSFSARFLAVPRLSALA
nr:hypothetical protein [Bacillus subtilis]